MGELKVSLFSVVSTAKGERGEFSLLRSINKGKLIFGEGEGCWRNWFLVL